MSSKEIALFVTPVGMWLVILAYRPAIRTSLGNGMHCLGRYPEMWQIPFFFAACHVALLVGQDVLIMFLTHNFHFLMRPEVSFSNLRIQDIVLGATLPAAESMAAFLNRLVDTFPLSALAAILFLVNYGGYSAELARALRKRFGQGGLALFITLVLCAIAAVITPVLVLGLGEAQGHVDIRTLLKIGTIINALSFVFEYLLGTCFQIYLVLVAYAWVRGLNFDREKLMHFAIRRLGFVMKWAVAIIIANLLLIHLPLYVKVCNMNDITQWTHMSILQSFLYVLLNATMISLFSVQITLVLHNESLEAAVRDHFEFLHNNASTALLFILQAFLLIWFWIGVEHIVEAWLRHANVLTWGWDLIEVFVSSLIGGWQLAAWVCFYKLREKRPVNLF